MNQGFDKFAALSSSKTKVGRLIIGNIQEFTRIYAMVEDFIAEPTADRAVELEAQFNLVAEGFDSVRNSINTLAKIVVSDEEPSEVDVTYDEQGARLM